ASSKTLTEMGSPAGKREIKRELKESFTSDLRLKEGDIRRVHFREFVIQ
ncbi:flagellar basal body-associated FliL family protein, partial [Candidatus Poribacteria bacterium]